MGGVPQQITLQQNLCHTSGLVIRQASGLQQRLGKLFQFNGVIGHEGLPCLAKVFSFNPGACHAYLKAKAFLFQVAYRQSVDNYRKKSKITYKEAPEETYSPANPDLKRILDRALAQLDEQARALVLLKDYEGYNYEEIGQITGLNESQVKVYLFRARKILKEYLVSVENII